MAWRAWTLDAGACLWSLNARLQWDGPVAHADVQPTKGNANGLYAVRDLGNVPYANAWGEVALSGIVVEGEFGYRAETATIRSLFVAREQRAVEPDGYHAGYTFVEWPDAALVAALEARYKVDVMVTEQRNLPSPMQIFTSPVMLQHQTITLPLNVQLIGTASTSSQSAGLLGGLGAGASGY